MPIIPTKFNIYKNNFPIIALVIADMIPLFGVFYYGWNAFTILLLYWSENLVVGFYNILRITFAQSSSTRQSLTKIISIPFFAFHYGAFCAVHGLFILVMFKSGSLDFMDTQHDWWGPFVFIQLLIDVLIKVYQTLPENFVLPFLAMFISHGISFVDNYIRKEEYMYANVRQLMNLPYNRIIIMHITIIAGGFLLVLLDSPVYLLVVLVLLKIIINLKLHIREHKRLQNETVKRNQ